MNAFSPGPELPTHGPAYAQSRPPMFGPTNTPAYQPLLSQPPKADGWWTTTPSAAGPSLFHRTPVWLRLVALGAAGLLILVIVSVISGPTGDKAACSTFYGVMNNSSGDANQIEGAFSKAASQASSPELKEDMQELAGDYSDGISIQEDGGNVFDDCANLGYPNPANN